MRNSPIRWTLFRKFLLAMVPTFAVFALLGLGLSAQLSTNLRAEDLALRIGNLAGRVASALGRHDALTQTRLAEDLLGAFGTDPAVLCVELIDPQTSKAASPAYPPGLGCKGMPSVSVVSIPVGDSGLLLAVHYSEDEIAQAGHRQWRLTATTLALALLATMVCAAVGYRLTVGRRLQALHTAITASVVPGEPRKPVPEDTRDELGDIARAFNDFVQREALADATLRFQNAQLAEQGRRDALTGVLNRRHFEAWAAEHAASSLHRERPGAIGILDIDRFKLINDNQGHAVGDEVLVAVCRRMTAALRSVDMLVRWGGEEFLVYLDGMQDMDVLAQRLLSAVNADPVVTSAGPLPVTASMGLVSLPQRVDGLHLSLDRALVLADRALYAAKNSGRNRAVCIGQLQLSRPSQMASLEDNLMSGNLEGVGNVLCIAG